MYMETDLLRQCRRTKDGQQIVSFVEGILQEEERNANCDCSSNRSETSGSGFQEIMISQDRSGPGHERVLMLDRQNYRISQSYCYI